MTQRIPLSLSIVSLLALSAVSLTTLSARAAEDPAKEVTTAALHAGFAAAAKDMKDVRMHLHHTVNCLVGPAGAGFDTKEANPCKGQGEGAIPDTKDPGKLAALHDALVKANDGLKQNDMAAAQTDARAAQDLIKKAM